MDKAQIFGYCRAYLSVPGQTVQATSLLLSGDHTLRMG